MEWARSGYDSSSILFNSDEIWKKKKKTYMWQKDDSRKLLESENSKVIKINFTISYS